MADPERAEIVLKKDSPSTSEAVRTFIEVESGKVEFSIVLGDITQVRADAIVCPANPGFEYAGFGGVQVAIAQKAGMATFEEAETKAKQYIASNPSEVSKDRDFVPLGFATSTTSGQLKNTKRIIHVNNMRVGRQPPCDEEVVRLSVGSVLAVADSENLESVAFPALGTGVWGMSMSEALTGTVKGMKDYYRNINPNSGIKKVSFVIYAEPSMAIANELRDILANEVLPKLNGEDNEQSQLPIGQEVMETLRSHVGESVSVQYVHYGSIHTKTEKLKRVTDFSNIDMESYSAPFVGYGAAIRMVLGQDGNVLYDNPLITEDYDLRSDAEIDEMVARTFGQEIASARIRERQKQERQRQRDNTRANKEARAKSESFVNEGLQIIKPELKDEWQEYVRKNTQDGYSAAVVDISIQVGKALSEDKTPEDASQIIDESGITGYMAGCVAQTISHFHLRGEEFANWWNRQYMTEEQAKEAKGVVNPAILTISPKY